MRDSTLICLQNIVLEDFYPQADALYLNKIVHGDNVVCDTATYINLLSFDIWKKNTTVSSFYLSGNYDGAGNITIHFADNKLHVVGIETISLDAETKTFTHRLKNIPCEYAFISWKECARFKLHKAAWLAECFCQPQHIRLAICIPTYKRRTDISKTIALYEGCCKKNSEFSESTCLFVHNNDTDDDLRKLSISPQVHVINSEANIGGAGAFNRCAHLAVNGGYTHALFMDDDALPHSEAWLRTLALLKYLRPEKKEHFIAGNALTRESPTFCHAIREAIDERGHIRRYRMGDFALASKEALPAALAACAEHDSPSGVHPYAAWWYCAIPCSAFQKHGWPDDRFFCSGDDIDFSLVCKARVICCNGINVWHPSFDRPKTLQRRYFAVRNHYLLLEKNFGNKYILSTFFKNILVLFYKKDYCNVVLVCSAFIAFLNKKFLPVSEISKFTITIHARHVSMLNALIMVAKTFSYRKKIGGAR